MSVMISFITARTVPLYFHVYLLLLESVVKHGEIMEQLRCEGPMYSVLRALKLQAEIFVRLSSNQSVGLCMKNVLFSHSDFLGG